MVLMWKWAIGIVVLYFLWKKMSPQTVASLPMVPQTLTSGDAFNRTTDTIAAGVMEPCTMHITPCSGVMTHVFFPTDPPPIQIQKPIAPVKQPVFTPPIKQPVITPSAPISIVHSIVRPTLPRPVSPIRTPILNQAKFNPYVIPNSGGQPNVAYLNMLANNANQFTFQNGCEAI